MQSSILTTKQACFVYEYLIDLNAMQAALFCASIFKPATLMPASSLSRLVRALN